MLSAGLYVFYTAAAYVLAAVLVWRLAKYPSQPLGPVTVRGAAWWSLTGWAVLFGWSVFAAILDLLDPFVFTVNTTPGAVLLEFGSDYLPRCVCAVLLFMAACRSVSTPVTGAGWPARVVTRHPVQWFAAATVAVWAVMKVAFFLSLIPALNRDPWARPPDPHQHPWTVLDGTLDSITAGITEELTLVAVPVLLLRRAGVRTRTVLLALIAARVSFHVYYGWVAVGLAGWAVTVAYLYLRTGMLWPLIIAHILCDAPGLGLDTAGYHVAGVVVLLAALVALSVTAVGPLAYRSVQRRRAFRVRFTDRDAAAWTAAVARMIPTVPVTVTGAGNQSVPMRVSVKHGEYRIRVGNGVVGMDQQTLLAALAVQAAAIVLGYHSAAVRRRARRDGVLAAVPLLGGLGLYAAAGFWHNPMLIPVGIGVCIVGITAMLAKLYHDAPAARSRERHIDERAYEIAPDPAAVLDYLTWLADQANPALTELLAPLQRSRFNPVNPPKLRREHLRALPT